MTVPRVVTTRVSASDRRTRWAEGARGALGPRTGADPNTPSQQALCPEKREHRRRVQQREDQREQRVADQRISHIGSLEATELAMDKNFV